VQSVKFWWGKPFRETRREVDERILEEADSYDSQEKARGYCHDQRHRKLLPAPHRECREAAYRE
jgi:hypothetical protein